MHKETAERVDRLRLRASKAEASLSKLKEQLAENEDEWVNAQLNLAGNFLTDVEAFFIGPLEKQEGFLRTVTQEAYILSNAEYVLEKVVIPQINLIGDAVTKYGPNLRAIG
jgi:hypothetical protein